MRRSRSRPLGRSPSGCGATTLGDALEQGDGFDAVREPALRAAATASLVLEGTTNLSVSVIIGQVRSTANDLLTGTGLSYEEAAEAVREAVQWAQTA